MVNDDGDYFLAFDSSEHSDTHRYPEALDMVQTLAVNCRGAASGQVTLCISDLGLRGMCPPGHPENYAKEAFIDVITRTCNHPRVGGVIATTMQWQRAFLRHSKNE